MGDLIDHFLDGKNYAELEQHVVGNLEQLAKLRNFCKDILSNFCSVAISTSLKEALIVLAMRNFNIKNPAQIKITHLRQIVSLLQNNTFIEERYKRDMAVFVAYDESLECKGDISQAGQNIVHKLSAKNSSTHPDESSRVSNAELQTILSFLDTNDVLKTNLNALLETGKLTTYCTDTRELNLRKIPEEQTTIYDAEDIEDFKQKTINFILTENSIALLKPEHKGRDWVLVKLGNVFISFYPGGKGSNSYNLFYKTDDGRFFVLRHHSKERWDGVCASAHIPVDVYFRYNGTCISRWSYSINCLTHSLIPEEIKPNRIYIYVDMAQRSVCWRSCHDESKIEKVSESEFRQFLGDLKPTKQKYFSETRSFKELNSSSMLSYQEAITLREKHGITCPTLEGVIEALSFRDDALYRTKMPHP